MSAQGTTAKPFVVVGVDGSPNSTKALRAALQQAAWRGADVHALIGWTYPVMYGMEGAGYVIDNESVEQSAFVALEEAIARACPDEAEWPGSNALRSAVRPRSRSSRRPKPPTSWWSAHAATAASSDCSWAR